MTEVDLYVYAEIFKTWLLGTLIFLVYIGPFRHATISLFQQTLFDIRNQLWDNLHSLNAIDAPAHRTLRQVINGLIESASYLDLIFFIRIFWAYRGMPTTQPTWTSEMKELGDHPSARCLSEASDQTFRTLVRYVFLGTLPGAIIGWPVWIAYKLGLFHALPSLARSAARTRRWITATGNQVNATVSANSTAYKPEFSCAI